MQCTLVFVRYRLNGDPARFRSDMDNAATMIAAVPGLIWKIWGFEPAQGAGLSAYLFETDAAARTFAAGPVIARLRSRSDVVEVLVDLAPVDHALSARTGAEHVLAARTAVAASISCA
jgi:hypothetical protein